MIAHFQRGSLVVRPGLLVRQGDLLGLAGNSGYSFKPHIHYQLQDSASLDASSLPAKFKAYYQVGWFRDMLRTNDTPEEGDLVRNTPTSRPSPVFRRH